MTQRSLRPSFKVLPPSVCVRACAYAYLSLPLPVSLSLPLCPCLHFSCLLLCLFSVCLFICPVVTLDLSVFVHVFECKCYFNYMCIFKLRISILSWSSEVGSYVRTPSDVRQRLAKLLGVTEVHEQHVHINWLNMGSMMLAKYSLELRRRALPIGYCKRVSNRKIVRRWEHIAEMACIFSLLSLRSCFCLCITCHC